MSAERLIHVGIFFLLLVGLTVLTAWAVYVYLHSSIALTIAGVALSWGLILLLLYVLFKRLNWKWWS